MLYFHVLCSTAIGQNHVTIVMRSPSVQVTASSGAFVAGMGAGRAYNTFPLMGGRWIPEEYWSDKLSMFRNFFENTAAVQVESRH